MKICFVSSMHPENDKRVHDKEARSLQKAGFDVVHICPGSKVGSAPPHTVDGVVVRQYVAGKGIRGRLLQLRRLYQLAKDEDADAYHCNEVDSWVVGVFLKIFCRKICVFDVHEHYPSTFAESRFNKRLQPIIEAVIRLLFKILLPFTDRVVLAKRTVSDDFTCSDKKKVLVQNFTPIGSLAVAGDRSPREPGSPMTVVHLGLFSKIRGWPEVLNALSQTDERVNLKIIGEINDGSLSEFYQRVTDLGLQGRVEVLEWMPFECAFSHLLQADVGLIAFQPHIKNHIFAMPHKLFDYMAAGMAVLIPKQAIEVAPIVENSKCGILIDPSESDDISQAIMTVFNDPELSHLMGCRGQQAVTEVYNWEAEAEKLINMYRELR